MKNSNKVFLNHFGIAYGDFKGYPSDIFIFGFLTFSLAFCGLGFWLVNLAFKEGYGTWYGYYFVYGIEDKIFNLIFSLIIGIIFWFVPTILLAIFIIKNKICLTKLWGVFFIGSISFLFYFLFWAVMSICFGFGSVFVKANMTYTYCNIGLVSATLSMLLFLPKINS